MKSLAKSGRPEETQSLLPEVPPHPRRRWSLLSFNTALNAVVSNGGAALEVAALLDQMNACGFPMDASSHNILLKLPSSSPTFARKVFDSMSERGFSPDSITFSTLISRLSKSGMIADACGILKHMIKSGRRLNPFCYTPILQALCSRGRTAEAEALIKDVEEAGRGPHRTVTKNILLSGLCGRQDFLAAERLLAAPGWRPTVITPSAVTINILLRCLCQYSGPEEGKKLIDESWRLEWEVKAVDFNAVMSAFSSAGKWAAAVPLLAVMLKMGVKPDERSFNTVLLCLCREGKIRKAKRMEGLGQIP